MFDICTNPSGIIYNPFSITESLYLLMNRTVFSKDDLSEHNGLYHSFRHHSSFSSPDSREILSKINSCITEGHEYLKQCRHLFLTIGTSWIYRLANNGSIAANCHKFPADYFRHELLSAASIADNLSECLLSLKNFNPDLNIIFTVSPVRHWKEGAVNNQRSKSVLIEAVHAVIEKNARCFYFPAYEIMMDDLRDYRFYADDMLHPSDAAVDYIYEKFCIAFFNESTRKLNHEIDTINKMLNHKPFFPDSKDHDLFKKKISEKIRKLPNAGIISKYVKILNEEI